MFTYSQVSNPVYANAEGTLINVNVLFDHLGEVVPFTASPDDVEEHGREIYLNAVRGDYGVIGDYIPVVLPPKGKTQLDKLVSVLVIRGSILQSDADGL